MQEHRKSAWNLLPIQTSGSKPPFFWVHGDASDLYLSDCLGPDQPVYGFKHQGRHGEPASFTQVETIAAYYLRQVRKIQVHSPYFLGGYSFGGTIAFEMAQQLQAEGENVPFLFMLDSLYPGFPGEHSPSSNISPSPTYFKEIQRHMQNARGLQLPKAVKYVSARLHGKFQERVGRAKKPLNGLLIKAYLAVGRRLPFHLRNQYILKIYFDALAIYDPKPYNGRAVYIKSSERPSVHSLRWNALMRGGLDRYEVAATNHMDIIKVQNASSWTEKLKTSLLESQELYRPKSMRNTAP